MTRQEAKKRITKLREVINRHRYLYHVLDKQEISDAASDSLKKELFDLENEFPELITPDSPTQRVGGRPLDKFEKIKHQKPMLSLQDAFEPEELQAWEDRIKKLVPAFAKAAAGRPREKLEYFAELKIDGFAISLVYRNGVLAVGSTRGDGRTGEDVTRNLKTIESIPLKLAIHRKLPPSVEGKAKQLIEKGKIEIRGEVYMTKDAFEKVNQERRKKGLSLYANPRNTAAGSIRQLNPKMAASRQLDFLAYAVVTDLGQKTHKEEHQITRSLGFKTNQGKYCSDLDKVTEFWQEISGKREKLTHQIDGVVVQVNGNRVFEKLGVVGKAPRGAIAFKFAAKEAATVIEDIVVQVGRTGAMTPVAKLKPIRIGGVLVSRATLHNEGEIRRLDVRIGDTVIVQRAGDVIPDVVKVVKKMRTGREKKFSMPKRCPICGGEAVRPGGEAVHRCVNKKCAVVQKRQISHFVSKNAFDIEGLGPKIVEQLIERGLINNPADIFTLEQGDLIPLERFGKKSAGNLINAISQGKRIGLARFIFALGIRHVGEETAVNLANHFGSLAKLKKAGLEELLKVKDIGQIVAKSLGEWFNERNNQQLIDQLIRNGVEIEKQKTVKRKLSGRVFVLTGQLDRFTRDEAKDKIREMGGDVSSSVSKETDYVVIGEEPGSKYDRARKLGIKIINEKEFLRMVK